MNEENYEMIYDAFISYRHTQPDQFVAEQLHKALETFKLPASIAKNKTNGRTKINRVFRDQEELPLANNLEDPIVEALKHSEYLIVICSPRLRESIWCRKEIETFIALHGREKIMAVLVEGEPSESFPEELLHREVTVSQPDGTTKTILEDIEPLAADFRGTTNADRKKAMKTELLRLLAPMFDLGYDDLKQRHRERRMRRLLAIVSGVAALCLGFGIFSTATALRIQKQKEQIETQAKEIQSQNEEISKQAEEISSQNTELKTRQAESLAQDALDLLAVDDRKGAIKTAIDALTTSDGIEMPYTDIAAYALTQALRPYDLGSTRKAIWQFEMEGTIENFFLSPDKDILGIYDSTNSFVFYNLATLEELGRFQVDDMSSLSESNYSFVSNDTFVYVNHRVLYAYTLSTGELAEVTDLDVSSYYLSADFENQRFFIDLRGDVQMYSSETFDLLETIELPHLKNLNRSVKILQDGKLAIIATPAENRSKTSDKEYSVTIYDPTTHSVLQDFRINDCSFEDCLLDGETLYVLTEKEINPEEILSGYAAHIQAYSLQTGAEQFHIVNQNQYGRKLYRLTEENKETLILMGSTGITAYDLADRHEIVSDFYDDRILWSGTAGETAAFLTGKPFLMFYSSGSTLGSSTSLECNAGEMALGDYSPYGMLFSAHNSNRVILYEQEIADYFTSYTEPLNHLYSLNFQYTYEKEAQRLDIPFASRVSGLCYAMDEMLCCVSYRDHTFAIYRLLPGEETDTENTSTFSLPTDMRTGEAAESLPAVSLGELLCTFQNEQMTFGIEEYLGKDTAGNTYWASATGAVELSPTYTVIQEFDCLREVDTANNRYIFGSKSNPDILESAPIYDISALLEIARELYNNK